MRACATTLGVLFAVVLSLSGCATSTPISANQAASERAGVQALRSSAAAVSNPPPLVAFIGDDYTIGAGTDGPTRRWTSILSRQEHWREENFAFIGAGYLAAVASKSGSANYATELAKAVKTTPSIVVVSGGGNDLASVGPALAREIKSFFTSLRVSLPAARVIAVNPWQAASPVPPGLTTIAGYVRAAVRDVKGVFVDVGQPVVGHPSLITRSGKYPNDKGYARLAQAVGAKLPNSV
ncbi:SGNH/GDSL hydrolase family protein [uncultured Jatrophihabitans sp.]|uniref:SGNH/GDSL hydrolase family protein n=1 Tax=uncultured Jatrophihabitans sp. TaxID=1610747 RepID=UPI0035CC88D3